MSDPADWPEVRRTMRSPSHTSMPPRRRSRWWLIIFIAIAIVAFGGRTWLSYYVDALWFGSLGYGQCVLEIAAAAVVGILPFLPSPHFFVLYGTFLRP